MRYGKPIYAACAVAMMAAFGIGVTQAGEPIGEVSEPNTTNAVAIAATSGATRALGYQSAVYENDTVITRDNGTQLQFTDQTLLNVSSNSKVVLDSFVFDKNTGSLTGTIKLGVGVFRFVTGALVKQDNLLLMTPVTAISIRGTDFVVSVEADGTTRVRLYEGAIRLKTCNGGTIWVRAGERITVSPACVAVVESVGTGAVVPATGNGGGNNSSGSGTRPSGGGASSSGGGSSPSGGGSSPSGGGSSPSGGGGTAPGGANGGANP